MLVYYFVPFIVRNRYLLFWFSNGHNSVTVQNRTHVYMNFFDHKDLGNHLLQLCPRVVKHPVFVGACYKHTGKERNISKINLKCATNSTCYEVVKVTASTTHTHKSPVVAELLKGWLTRKHNKKLRRFLDCVKNPTRCSFSCVFILKFAFYMFRTDTHIIIWSLCVTVYIYTYHANGDWLLDLVS